MSDQRGFKLSRCFILIFCFCFTLGADDSGNGVDISRPNFLLFIVDDLGYGDIGCFGNTTLRTPNIDSLATTGTKMTHVLAASAYCTPSRSAILTGRYPVRIGMAPSAYAVHLFLGCRAGLPEGTITFPKLLQNAGYTTGLVGKWHLGLNCNWMTDFCHHPNNQGFDHFYGLPLTNMLSFADDPLNVIAILNPRTFLIFNTILTVGIITATYLWYVGYRKSAILLLLPSIIIPGLGYWVMNHIKLVNSVLMRNGEIVEQPIRLWTLTRRYVHESKNFIERQHSAGNPFLLLITFTHVHAPIMVHPSMKGRSQHGLYGDSVEEVDWAVGELLQTLDKFNLRNNTVVMFTSDHGTMPNEVGPGGELYGGSNGPFSGGKGMYGMEGALRVPTIFSWPNQIPQNSIVDTPASLMDIFPTILRMAKVDHPSMDGELDGENMLPLLMKETKNSKHQFLFHYGRMDHIHAITYVENRTAVWKVHYIRPKWIPGTRQCQYMCSHWPELLNFLKVPLVYNVIDDPGEWKPLGVDDHKRRMVLETVQQALEDHLASVVPALPQMTLMNSIWLPWLQPCCNFPYCSCEEAIDNILS